MSTTIEKIQRQIAENPILLYMKGSPKLPTAVSLPRQSRRLPHVNALPMLIFCRIRTFVRNCRNMLTGRPSRKLWVDGGLVGGCDIVIEMLSVANSSSWNSRELPLNTSLKSQGRDKSVLQY